MPDQTEKVTTVFGADTSALDQAFKRVGAGFADYSKQNRGAVSAAEELTSSFTGLDRAGVSLSGSLKGIGEFFKSGGALSKIGIGAGIIGTVAVAAFSKFAAEAEDATEKLRAFDEQFRKTTRSDTFARASGGSSSLASRIVGNREQQKQIRELITQNSPTTVLGRIGQATGDAWQYGPESAADMRVGIMRKLSEQQSLAGRQGGDMTREFGKAISQESQVTIAGATGQTDHAAQMQIEITRQRELNALQEAGLDFDENKAAVNAKQTALQERITQDRGRSIFYAQEEVKITELTAKGLTDMAAQERLRLNYAKEYSQLKLSGGSPEELAALKKREELEGRQLRNAQALSRAQFGSDVSSARIGGNLSVSDTQRQLGQAALKLNFLKEELAASVALSLSDEKRRALALELLATQNQMSHLRSQYRTERAASAQRGEEVSISGNLQSSAAEKEAALAQSKLDFLQREMRIRISLRDISKEEIADMQIQAREAQGALNAANARARTEREGFNQRRKEQGIAGSNSPTKSIETARSKISFLRGQLARTDISEDQRREMTLDLGGAQNDLRQSKQDRDFDLRNRPGDRNARDAKEAREQTLRDKFDAQQALLEQTGSVIGGDQGSGLRGSLFGPSGPMVNDDKPMSPGEAALQRAGDKKFLANSKVSTADKSLTILEAQLEVLRTGVPIK